MSAEVVGSGGEMYDRQRASAVETRNGAGRSAARHRGGPGFGGRPYTGANRWRAGHRGRRTPGPGDGAAVR